MTNASSRFEPPGGLDASRKILNKLNDGWLCAKYFIGQAEFEVIKV